MIEHAVAGAQQAGNRLRGVEHAAAADTDDHVDVAAAMRGNRVVDQLGGRLVVDDDLLLVEILFQADAVAGLAGAGRIVEGEQTRLQFADAVAADRTREQRGEHHVYGMGSELRGVEANIHDS